MPRAWATFAAALAASTACLASGFGLGHRVVAANMPTRHDGRRTDSVLLMSRRSRRRKRGAAAAERASGIDVVAPADGIASSALGHRAKSRGDTLRELPPPPFPYLCVCDVEATCEEFSGFKNYEHEIIEFPVVVIDLRGEGAVLGEFHSYVRPTVNTTLSEFCTRLTGISQELVDAAPTLPEVLEQFDEWRIAQGLNYTEEQRDFAFAADGPWDLRFFLHGECSRKGIAKPAYFDKWCNIKELFADHYHVKSCKIHKMLQLQGMKFEGRLHSGIDDTRNIARIAAKMRLDGAPIYCNEALPKHMRAAALAEQD